MLTRYTGYFACVLVLFTVVLMVLSSRNPRPRPAGVADVRMPALALEFADSDEALYRIIGPRGSTDPEVAALRSWYRTNIRVDYVFIVFYWILFVLLAGVLAQRGSGWPVWAAGAVVLAVTGAALFDLVENVRMTRVLETVQLAGNDVATAGFMKWLLSFVALALLSLTFFGRGGWVWVVGAVCLLIAGLGLGGLVWLRAGGGKIWPIGAAFTLMMLVLLPLVALAFTRGRDAFTADDAGGRPGRVSPAPRASVPGD
jgi:hypothetical protein